MTTSTDTEVEAMENQETEKRERSIDELYDLPYSEMTEEEIERIVQYKADKQTRTALYNEQIQQISDTLEEVRRVNMEAAQQAMEQLDQMTAHTIQRFKDASQ